MILNTASTYNKNLFTDLNQREFQGPQTQNKHLLIMYPIISKSIRSYYNIEMIFQKQASELSVNGDCCSLYHNQLLTQTFEKMTSSYLKEPMLTKKTKVHSGSNFTATSCEMQGWRKTMEDALVYEQLADDVYLFAVCDGHGGPQVAHLVAKKLPGTLKAEADFKAGRYGRAIISAFYKIDELISSQRGEEQLKSLNKSLKGKSMASEEKIGYRAGTTCLALILTKDKYYIGNVGDSRGVLCQKNQAIALSNDHKPENPSERQRIEKAGGYVHNGRVNNSLALSRSLGDFQFKHFSSRCYEEQAVTSLPDVIEVSRSKEDNFILLACDGIWEKYVDSNQKMVDHCKRLVTRFNDKDVMEKLLDDLVAKNETQILGCDNMSGILIEF